METRKKRTKLCMSLLALGLILVYALTSISGSLEPSGPPGSTMKTLDEIYDAAASVLEREGYMKHYEVDPCSSETFFTVPTGKKFVLMKLWFSDSDPQLYLTVNDNLFISSRHYPFAIYSVEYFPDRCVTANSGDILKVVNFCPGVKRVTIVGYFCDIP